MIRMVIPAAFGLMLASCAGVYGPKGNDTGGIIPWSPDNERMAYDIAQGNCGFYNKHAVLRTINRVPGDFISYECWFDPPRRGQRGR